ncbi:hypothetical protein [Variovorax sp. OV329]|uniref:hypothetical protein n=1 Tax=Variovorax sp. OV329 TaxID=1882825 RepID=UPI0008EDCE0D|nr:hypothetical protein [Variovorax sp. OV329]SFM44688.1 hypothetical protein SAMN05444747_105246 [Variovorax sp. OV329]
MRLTAGLLLIGTALQSSALTIGRPNGSAWIGKPLDLVIPLELDSSESGDSLCLEAEVLQGDARVDDKRVTLSMDPGPSPDMPRVRLRTTRAIEEPVVTVKFTAGCATKSTRQYVLLADLPEAPPVIASPPRLAPGAATEGGDRFASPSSRPAPARAAGSAASRAASAGGDDSTVAAPPPLRRRTPTAVPVAPSATEASRKPRPQPPKAAAATTAPANEPRSRLRIEALAPEPVPQAQTPRPTLAPGSGAAGATAAAGPGAALAGAPAAPAQSPPAADAAANVSAAAVLAAATEQGRRDADRLKELEAALATLRDQSAQTQRQLLELRGSLAQAEASRYRNPVIYGLLALLALALIGLVVLWRAARNARQAAWWGTASEEEAAAAGARPVLPRHGELAEDEEDEEEEDEGSQPADLSGLRTTAAQGMRVTSLPAGVGASAFHQTQVRPVNAEELFDVQQQSDFFVSLGQHEQAIGVLREHIAANPNTSAMAYLDLLAVLHSLGRREDYAAVAREFAEGSNVDVPSFDHFTLGGRGMEHYREALQRIVDKWPSQGTAELIEDFVFRKPGSPEESFDLPAYQELLMLYSVVRDLGEYEGQWATPTPVKVQPPTAVSPEFSEHAYRETSPMPYLPQGEVTAHQPAEVPPLELDLADLDRTAFETLRAPIEPAPAASKPQAVPSVDPHVIDFDPFDPATNQGDLRPRHLGVKR